MKKLVLILGLVFSLSGWAEQTYTGFEQIYPRHGAILSEAKKEASNWLDKYLNLKSVKEHSSLVQEATFIKQKLNSISFYKETHPRAFIGCYPEGNKFRIDLTAFVDVNDLGSIFLCSIASSLKSGAKGLAQVLVHELYHLWEGANGSTNDTLVETAAGNFELNVTIAANQCVFDKTTNTEETVKLYPKKNYHYCN